MSGGAKFAKLFETERTQILVKRDSSEDDGRPEVRFYFQPYDADLGVCSCALTFGDGEAGEAAADKVFNEVDQDGAQRLVFAHLDSIATMFAEGAA